eukprot:330544-Karenia_brevis.AAC.1
MEKIKPRMEYGIFVGVSRKSGEFLVSDKDGIRRAPWRRYRDAEDADGDVPEGIADKDRRKKESSGETQEKVPGEN